MDNPSNATENQQPQTPLLRWEFPSFIQHDRSMFWYIGLGVILVGLLVYSFINKNYLFAVIIVLFAVVMVARQFRVPERVAFEVNEDGIQIHDRAHRFREFATFWIAYEPPAVKMLYLTFKSGIRPSYPIPLQDQNPLRVRAVLQKYIREDLERETEDLTDRLARTFKI
ncbi:MAG: hypothetical protein WCV85_05610 [Patescibacteria group bacterium]